MSDQLTLLRGAEIWQLLQGREHEIIEAVSEAYRAHARQQTSMPPNAYLRFPDKDAERIIAKPAFIGGGIQSAGIKWVASFPGNLKRGMERASATMIMNSVETGRPTAVLESSIISAKRTAASAALAAHHLYFGYQPDSIGLLGCGVINFETLRFLLSLFPSLRNVSLCDLSTKRAETFALKVKELKAELTIQIVDSFADLLLECPLIALATTAVTPHLESLDGHSENTLILHTSLRDLSPEVVLAAHNVVDDIDQVCSEKTSLHLAEERVGHRHFIQSTIGQSLIQSESQVFGSPTIFSPFGLGILDVAVASLTLKLAQEHKVGTTVEGFNPVSWLERE